MYFGGEEFSLAKKIKSGLIFDTYLDSKNVQPNLAMKKEDDIWQIYVSSGAIAGRQTFDFRVFFLCIQS